MCAADKVSIYDGAPIEGLKLPINPMLGDSTLSHMDTMHTSREYGDSYIVHKALLQAQDAITTHMQHDSLQAEGGPLQDELQDWVKQRITWHTGSNKLLQLRSWWSILTTNTVVPKHTHNYQTKNRTISGIVWVQGDICPLHQECCACENEELCFRCIHLAENLAKVGIDTIYTGGSTTIKANVKSAIIKNPLINSLPKAYK